MTLAPVVSFDAYSFSSEVCVFPVAFELGNDNDRTRR